MNKEWCSYSKKSTRNSMKPKLSPTWQYFGTITCDRLHGIMQLSCILINPKSEFSASLQTIYLWGTKIFFQRGSSSLYNMMPKVSYCGYINTNIKHGWRLSL